jgi:hypothetical protein
VSRKDKEIVLEPSGSVCKPGKRETLPNSRGADQAIGALDPLRRLEVMLTESQRF